MEAKHAWPTVFLAEDDEDDRYLFEQAFAEVSAANQLVMVNDGVELMQLLQHTVPPPPQVIFLDLNMPLKTGFQCLAEIRRDDMYKHIPVVIFSTSTNGRHIDQVFEEGANYYLFKPNSYIKLKDAIAKILSIDWQQQARATTLQDFVLSA